METSTISQWATVKLARLEAYNRAVMFGTKAEQEAAWKAYKDARIQVMGVKK